MNPIISNITIGILLTALIGGIIYDAIIALTGNKTFSEIIKKWSFTRYPCLPFFLSMLPGHFFWEMGHSMPFWVTAIVLLNIMGFLQLLTIFIKYPKWSIAIIPPFGYICGALFFPL